MTEALESDAGRDPVQRSPKSARLKQIRPPSAVSSLLEDVPNHSYTFCSRGSSWGQLLRRIWRRIQSDDCFDLAAQTSFYFSLSLLPFCLILAVIVGKLPSTAIWKAFATWIVTYLPRDSQRLMFSTILGLAEYPTGFLSLGLITALWSAAAGFVSL